MIHVENVSFIRSRMWQDRGGPYEKMYWEFTLRVFEADTRLNRQGFVRRAVWYGPSDWLDMPDDDTVQYSTFRNPFSLVVSKYLLCKRHGDVPRNQKPQLNYY